MTIQECLDLIQEAKKTSRRVVTYTRKTKIKRATGQMSTALARRKKDPMYKRMLYHKQQYLKLRDALHRRYASKVRQRARR
jgi:hypothetical protein